MAVLQLRCTAAIYKRDTYRRVGAGRFKMHYSTCQCERAAVADGRCKQHADRRRFWQDVDYFDYVERTPALRQ